MNTKIKFTYKDVPYTLEYDRSTIKSLEKAGFNIQDVESHIYTTVELAFRYAFLKNHKDVKEDIVQEIYSQMNDKDELIKTLLQMIGETYNTLLDSGKGNIAWDIASQ